jgi:Asp/Glu/hydantoin racemase
LTVLELRENDLIQRLVSCCKEFEKDRITTVILGCTGMNRAADAVQLA